MKRQNLLILLVAALLFFQSACNNQPHYKALIVTGQNNHLWKASYPVLKLLLDQTGLFTTDTLVSPPRRGDMSKFDPKFSNYDVIVLDYNGDSWSDKTKKDFVDYVKNGGGVVVYHAADNSFPDWKEYNEIIGLGGWGNRNEKSGPYVYYKGNEIVRDTSKGIGGTHAARSDYVVKMRNLDHPITKGMPVQWMHANDELYSLLRGPGENMEILATALTGQRMFVRNPNAPPAGQGAPNANIQNRQGANAGQGTRQGANANQGTRPGTTANQGTRPRTAQGGAAGATAANRGARGQQGATVAPEVPAGPPPRDEPVLFTIKYGKGRIFHTVLGHADKGGGPAMQCVGFIVTFQRGAEWAASGKVTQKIPFDFPTVSGTVLRPDFKEMTLDDAVGMIGSYEIEKSTKYHNLILNYIQNLAGDEKGLQEIEKKMVDVLKSKDATVESKKLILRDLSWIGSDYSVSAIKDLSGNPELKDEAEFALARLKPGN